MSQKLSSSLADLAEEFEVAAEQVAILEFHAEDANELIRGLEGENGRLAKQVASANSAAGCLAGTLLLCVFAYLAHFILRG